MEQKRAKALGTPIFHAAETDIVLRVDQSVRLADGKDYVNRFEINSETSDRVYTISQHRTKRFWCCSCPAWRSKAGGSRNCKHLRAMGLPGDERPYEARLE